MSNIPVVTGQASAQLEQEEDDNQSATRISFRVRVDALTFHKRVAQYFFECHLIPEPKLSLLAKACLNIVAHKYAKQEEINLANYVQRKRNLAQARGLNVVSVPQISREMAATGHPPKENSIRHDSKLRRPPPIGPVQEPEWVGNW
jgi:hypothetical protein